MTTYSVYTWKHIHSSDGEPDLQRTFESLDDARAFFDRECESFADRWEDISRHYVGGEFHNIDWVEVLLDAEDGDEVETLISWDAGRPPIYTPPYWIIDD